MVILREATIKYKGYDPDDLSKGLDKRVCVSCDICGRIRYVRYCAYRSLCLSCARSGENNPFYGKTHSNESKKLMRESHEGISLSDKTCQKMSLNNIGENNPNYGKEQSLESRIKCSCTKQGINIENFSGFIGEQKYCIKFNEKLKTQIRNQYDNCDYISGIHKDICDKGKNLDVHHVDYDKDQGCGKNFNLIPLSKSNHMKTNYNRSFWNRLFIYSLEIDKWYYEVE